MSREKQIEETVVQKTTYGEAHLAIGDGIPRPLTTVINCKKIIIAQKSIGVEIDVSENFERTDTIIVNGVEYHKQSEGEWKQMEFWEGGGTWRCTECGRQVMFLKETPKTQNLNYCPECGAKMKGGE